MPSATLPRLPRPARKVGAPLTAIIALGAVAVVILALLAAVEPEGAAVGIALSTAGMVVAMVCYRWLDRWEPEPRRLLLMAFLWGASVAVLLAVAFEHMIEQTFGDGLDKASFTTVAVGAPLVEEAAKGLFLVLMMTGRRRRELNTMTDCLVYAGLTAVGFAWLENIFYIASAETLRGSLTVAGLRLIFAPFAHPLFTTMFGIGVYFALKQRTLIPKLGYLLLGYSAAVVMHALWNGSAMLGAKAYLTVYLLWMLPVCALAIALGIGSRRRERQIVEAKLPGMVASGLVTPHEAAWLYTLASRRAAIKAARRIGGRSAGTAVKRFATQVVKLAYVRDRIDRGFGDERVLALHNEEAYAVAAARAHAGPVLAQLNGVR